MFQESELKMWLYVLLNIISMICWTFLAVRFDMWWIALFALLFMFIPKQVTVRKHYRICDKCGKHSPYADSQDEAISKAKKIGWVSYKNENNVIIDYCPECQKKQ